MMRWGHFMVTTGRRTQRHHEASLKAGVREVYHQMNFNANFDKVGGLINVVVTLQKLINLKVESLLLSKHFRPTFDNCTEINFSKLKA